MQFQRPSRANTLLCLATLQLIGSGAMLTLSFLSATDIITNPILKSLSNPLYTGISFFGGWATLELSFAERDRHEERLTQEEVAEVGRLLQY